MRLVDPFVRWLVHGAMPDRFGRSLVLLGLGGFAACSGAQRGLHRQSPARSEPAWGCPVRVEARPMALAGDVLHDGAQPIGWIGDRLVYGEVNRDDWTIAAVAYDPAARRWTRHAHNPHRTPPGAAKASVAFSNERWIPTRSGMLFLPLYRNSGLTEAGAVFDPVSGRWTSLAEPTLDWNRGDYDVVAHENLALLWSRRAVHGRPDAPLPRGYLIDLTNGRTTPVPDPPIDVEREDFALLFDGRWLVIWGGERRNQYNNPDRVFADGAVYDLREQRWRALPPGPRARIGPQAFLHHDRLTIIAGLDPIRAYELGYDYDVERDDVVADAWEIDLHGGEWRQLSMPWPNWRRHPRPLQPCAMCGPYVEVGQRVFFNNGMLFDRSSGRLSTLPRAPITSSEATERTSVTGHGLDSRRALFIIEAPERLEGWLLDVVDGTWCAVDLPPEVGQSWEPHRHAYRGALYLLRPAQTSDVETEPRPAEGAIVTLAPAR